MTKEGDLIIRFFRPYKINEVKKYVVVDGLINGTGVRV